MWSVVNNSTTYCCSASSKANKSVALPNLLLPTVLPLNITQIPSAAKRASGRAEKIAWQQAEVARCHVQELT
jgi:hypothetical protein